jgi:phage antirepressor YoqD-like protein
MVDQRPEPVDFVAEAHARGLLTFFEVAKLLDLQPLDVIDLMRDGEIEHERIDNKPCASLAALDAYRRRRVA